jgi:hypothetical protein
MSENKVHEEKLAENLIVLESNDSVAIEDRMAFLRETGWNDTALTFDCGKFRVMLEKAAA